METSVLIVGVIGNVISVLMFLSPVKTFWRIVKNRSTEDFESLPYVCTLLSSSLWNYYGIIKPGAFLVATISGFGVVVELVFVTLFLLYSPPMMKRRTAILVGLLNVGFFTTAVLVTRLALEGEVRIDAAGFMSSALDIVMYGSPLAAMKTVVTTKSVEYMPFLLSLFCFLNGAVWTLYAVFTRDIFIGVPNGAGFLLGTTQLVLYAIYRNAEPSRNTNIREDGLEEGWQNESLISSTFDR
ncbi:hypothetical protein K2173_022351 [Erythroxylum novogranatense]|uniref:Bidirectional sugar transporter SWEET n=1 Tax=Erythroxylum novogranatense TaxID=1862640 RepID=A0AAV8THK4_9ROSI|nr:hypothetical protein K2173_022351 [Erythroxylum novogranatense]